jgi:ribonuclease VapC
MTLDSSALLAILFAEPGYLDLVDRILEADVVRVGAPTLAETAIVLTARRTTGATSDLEALLRELGVVVVPFSEAHHAEAVRAYRAFGRGRHRAALNFGDCLSYAVASLAGDALLFVGKDFARTDLRSA